MTRRLILAACLLLPAVIGCGGDKMPPWPPFAMTIPDDVPDEMTVVDKDGTSHAANGKELYTSGYRAGWRLCVRAYDRGELDLAVHEVEPPPLGHYGIVVRGHDDGYRACWEAICKAKASNKKRAERDSGGSK